MVDVITNPAPVPEQKQKTAAELKVENDELETQIIRRQKIEEMQRQGGKAILSVPEAKPESPGEYAKRVMRGDFNKK